MSADNGIMLTTHPNGGYALVNYFLSSDEPVVATPEHPQFTTVEAAVMAYSEGCDTTYWSEYGLSSNLKSGHHNHNSDCEDTLCKHCNCCEYCEACGCEGKPGCVRTGCGCGD